LLEVVDPYLVPIDETSADEEAPHSLCNPGCNCPELVVGGLGDGAEDRRAVAVVVDPVHAVDDEDVEVRVDAQRRVRSVDRCDRAHLPAVANAAALTVALEDLADEDAQDRGQELAVDDQRVPDVEGQREPPVPHRRRFGEYAVDEVGSRRGHPLRAARRASCPALAGERDEQRLTTRPTLGDGGRLAPVMRPPASKYGQI